MMMSAGATQLKQILRGRGSTSGSFMWTGTIPRARQRSREDRRRHHYCAAASSPIACRSRTRNGDSTRRATSCSASSIGMSAAVGRSSPCILDTAAGGGAVRWYIRIDGSATSPTSRAPTRPIASTAGWRVPPSIAGTTSRSDTPSADRRNIRSSGLRQLANDPPACSRSARPYRRGEASRTSGAGRTTRDRDRRATTAPSGKWVTT